MVVQREITNVSYVVVRTAAVQAPIYGYELD
jgi:hypothetical protein